MRTIHITAHRAGHVLHYKRHITPKQIAAAKQNIKKANRVWRTMSHLARSRAMPEIHTKRWISMVRKLKKSGRVRTPEALATYRLGAKSFKSSHLKSHFIKVSKLVHRKAFRKSGYKRSGFRRSGYIRSGYTKSGILHRGSRVFRIAKSRIRPSRIKPSYVKSSYVHPSRVHASRIRISGYQKK